jgi:hypothetical protein
MTEGKEFNALGPVLITPSFRYTDYVAYEYIYSYSKMIRERNHFEHRNFMYLKTSNITKLFKLNIEMNEISAQEELKILNYDINILS